MSITELELNCRAIATSYSIKELTSLRIVFEKMERAGELSFGIYKGLRNDIRDRADWLKRR